MCSLPSTVDDHRSLMAQSAKPLPQPTRPASAADRPVAIEISDVSKRFNIGSHVDVTLKDRLLSFRPGQGSHFDALSEVNFSVAQGESFGILGHNGSGKSTLLKIVAGTLSPTSGRVRVAGRLSALLELGAGFHPDLTGRENVYLNGSILGFPKAEIEKIFEEIVDFAGLEEFIDLQVKYYSSGMTARLGFAVATNLDPDVLLVDEVLAVGDEAFQLKCFEQVHHFRALGRTMVIVSHGPERIRDLCDRAMVLNRGKMLFVGDVDSAIDVYRAALHGPPESTKTEEEDDEDAADDTEHSGPVRIGHIRVGAADPSGQAPVYKPGDSVPIRVVFHAREAMDVRVRIVLRTAAGVVLVNRSTSDILSEPVTCQVGKNAMRFILKNLPLLDGTYLLTALIETPDGSQTLDRAGKAGEIKVVGPGAGYGQVSVDVACQELALD